MINGAIRKALDLAKRKMQPQQGPSIQSPAPQIPRQKDMPVDPTRSKSSQERKKFQDGGQVMKHDKLNDALDIALSATHPKRLHHTLARTGYADGGLPDLQGPADLAKEVPYTHDKALKSQFDVAKVQPYKASQIAPGPIDVKLPKKSVLRAPRSDIGKMRVRKIRALKPKKLKFAKGGAAIEDALNLASRTMSNMAKHIGDDGVHGASMQQGSTSTIVKEKLPGKKSEVVYEHHAKTPTETETFASGGGAWTRKEGQNPEGGLNAKGRASAKAEGHNLKPPAPHPKTEKDAGRRKSFCSRMKGMKAKLTSSATANDPDSRINKSLRAWNCRADGGRLMHQDIIDALRLAEDRQNYAVGGRQKGRTSVTSPTPMPSNFPTGLPTPVNPNDPNTKFTYKGGSGINPELERLYGTGMFIPPEVSGRRSSLNPFYRPDMKPTDATPFQADLGRPDPQKIGYGPDGKIVYAPGYKGSGVNPELEKIGYGPNGEIAYAPGYKGSGVNPELEKLYGTGMFVPPEVSGRRSSLNPFYQPGMSPVKPVSPIPPPMGDTGPLRPKRPINPLLPAGYGFDPRGERLRMGLTPPAGMGDVNYYGNSVLPPGPLNPGPAGMGDVNYYGNRVLPPGPLNPGPADIMSPRPSNPFTVDPSRPTPDFMYGAGQGQMPQPTPLEQLGPMYPGSMPGQMPFANFGGAGTKAGPAATGTKAGPAGAVPRRGYAFGGNPAIDSASPASFFTQNASGLMNSSEPQHSPSEYRYSGGPTNVSQTGAQPYKWAPLYSASGSGTNTPYPSPPPGASNLLGQAGSTSMPGAAPSYGWPFPYSSMTDTNSSGGAPYADQSMDVPPEDPTGDWM